MNFENIGRSSLYTKKQLIRLAVKLDNAHNKDKPSVDFLLLFLKS